MAKACGVKVARTHDRLSGIGDAECSATSESSGTEEQSRLWLAEVSRHRSRVVAYLRCVTHDPTEIADLLAEAVAQAWCAREVGGCCYPDELELLRHARSACAKWMAAHRREIAFDELDEDFAFESPHAGESQGDDPLYEEFVRTLEWMRQLPQQQHFALVFRLLRRAHFDQVAAAMGCSVSAAKTHYYRGVDALKRRRLKEGCNLDCV